MKWAICLDNSWNVWYWNGEIWTQDSTQAALFVSKELAEKAMYRLFTQEEPEDEDDYAFMRQLCVKEIQAVPA